MHIATTAAIAAAAGAGVAYSVDKLNIGTANQRNLGMLALGVVAAVVLRKRPIGASIGAGIASVGLTRAVVLHQNSAAATAAIRGLGTGDGDEMGRITSGDMNGIGEVVPGEIGEVVLDYGY